MARDHEVVVVHHPAQDVVTLKFGKFGHDLSDAFFHDVLLVGNFGDGKINAFDIPTGASLGTLKNPRGEPLAFDGLWELVSFDDRLYFTAGIADESYGLFGFIKRVERLSRIDERITQNSSPDQHRGPPSGIGPGVDDRDRVDCFQALSTFTRPGLFASNCHRPQS
jgi:hypothetical protein